MTEHQVGTLTDLYREGIEYLRDDQFGRYVTKAKLNQEQNSDTEVWNPSNEVLQEVPNALDIKVELITAETNLNEVNKKLRQNRIIGLVVMGKFINRSSLPSLIVLTTRDTFYAIRPDDYERGIKFLRIKLADTDLEFWTTNGIQEADCLMSNYNIDLEKSQATCCSGVHIHIMQSIHNYPSSALQMYPPLIRRKCRGPPKIESFENLVENWLDIHKEDIYFDKQKLQHLKSRPLNLTAINSIKKRCLLVRPLAKTLRYFSWCEAQVMSRNAFCRLTMASEQVRMGEIEAMSKFEEEGTFDPCILAHLEGTRDKLIVTDE